MTALQLLGAAIRNQREQLHLTQEELATYAGLTTAYLGKVERGKCNASVLTLMKIANALHIPLVHIIEPLDILSHLTRISESLQIPLAHLLQPLDSLSSLRSPQVTPQEDLEH